MAYPPMCVVLIAALIALAPMVRRPFQKRLWKPHYWLVLTHLLFFAGAIALGVLRPNPDPHREGDPAALRLLSALWWGSLASCAFWIWRMKGFRWWACALIAILQAPLAGITVDDLADPRKFFRFGSEPVAIDVLPGIDGVDFDAAWERRVQGLIDPESGLTAFFISSADLVAAKLAAGRPQDLADVEAVRKSAESRRGGSG